MKLLIILLFSYSNYSFSSQIAGTGLTCYSQEDSNWNKYSGYFFKEKNIVRYYSLRKKNGHIKNQHISDLKYSLSSNFIKIDNKYTFFKINRKTLELVSKTNAKCKKHNSLLEVLKQMLMHAKEEQNKYFSN
tara:strand:- start:919 stop:1314 length:396 start_codon:yes stop_codon:yes gene_type:complete